MFTNPSGQLSRVFIEASIKQRRVDQFNISLSEKHEESNWLHIHAATASKYCKKINKNYQILLCKYTNLV